VKYCTVFIFVLQHVDLFRNIQMESPEWFTRDTTTYWAIRHGYLSLLKWLKDNNMCFLKEQMMCSEAALSGHLEVLKWLRENGCPWNRLIYRWASNVGHFHIVKWLRENGCELN